MCYEDYLGEFRAKGKRGWAYSPSEITDHSRIPIMISSTKNGKKDPYLTYRNPPSFRSTREEKP